MAKYGIGQAITRREDQRLLLGTGQYVDDMAAPGEVFVAFVRSPHARARIVSIDTTEARAMPGVLDIFVGADLAADGVGPIPINPGLKRADGKPMSGPPNNALAIGEVMYVGEAVAAVVAQTRIQAEDAAEKVQVEYEEKPAVVTIEAAMKPGAPQLWPDAPGNIAAQTQFGNKQACDEAFARAKHVTKVEFHNQRLVPVSMEPRGSIGEFDAKSGRMILRTSCQNPAGLQGTLADAVFKVPRDNVRVLVGDVGGGFGMKTQLYPEDIVCVWAARKLGRPVRWRASRSEEFLAGNHGRDQTDRAEIAFDAEGRILGLRVEIVGNIGAHASGPGAVIVVAVGPKVITGVYHVPALHLKATAVLTNTNVVGAYRGAGRPEAIYLIERLMDQAAYEMKMDPAELRRRNLIQPSQMPYTTPMGEQFDSGNFPHMLDRILKHADWKGFEARKRESQARGRLRGRAISTFLEWTGVVHEETIDLHVTADGRVRVFTAMQAMGQGIETSYVQIVSETLGIDAEKIEIVQGDSDIAQGIGSMGSRSLYIGGSAMLTASRQTIDKGRELASEALEAAAADIVYQDGRFSVAGTDLAIGLFDLAARQPEQRIAIKTLQKVGGPSWPNSCHVCEVEVDPETGVTEIVRYTTVDDVGRVINPLIVAGQVHGGIAQAVGQALMEQAVYDPESGQLLTGSLLDYCLPRADDLPNFDTYTDETT
ncbi:MAG TPA: xanthine dehydrogenase family protein molybdopterin-binding subunit, partial [Burkholderiales bacterium]|nr:xanthine dehydrogenase family protein molybdopterin-binding subunit [Burkholderiales bacterium]